MADDKNESLYAGHRNRLRQKFLDDKLSDYELLELMLAYAIPRRDVRPLARMLFQKYKSLYNLMIAPIDELMNIHGVGRNTAIFIKALKRTMQLGYTSRLKSEVIFHDQNLIPNYCRLLLDGKTNEEIHVLYIDNQWHLIADVVHTNGTCNETAVYPREIVHQALGYNASHIVLVHNHPRSEEKFSTPDILATNEVIRMLKPFNIDVYDHYIVSNGIVFSARTFCLLN